MQSSLARLVQVVARADMNLIAPAEDVSRAVGATGETDSYERAWQLYVSLEHQVQVADRKVQAIFSVNALLVAALSLQSQSPLREAQASLDLRGIVLVIGHAGLLALVGAATLSAIFALRPRLRLGRSTGPSSYFFGDIASTDAATFARGFTELSRADAAKKVLEQIHVVASILSAKYRWSGRATRALTGSLVVWILLQLLRFFS